jgi:glycerol-3-phosphate dehydrogenase
VPNTPTCDLFVIGGGVNGAAVARDAAGRGLNVMLAERDDYAQATSSQSSKLIHGGLRYLEHFEFTLVREALGERRIMLDIAPHLVRPLRFLVPVGGDQKRPAWMIWLGLKLYDFLSGRQRLATSGRLTTAEIEALPRLRRKNLSAVLHYHDCWVDDARLVLSILLDARARGADVANYREVTGVVPAPDGYYVHFREGQSNRKMHTRFVVNAGGPWANRIADITQDRLPRRKLRLVRGSHIVLAMPEPADRDAYTLQNTDGRVVFTIPWLDGRYLVIGTTDAPHDGDPGEVACSEEERDYLLACYNRYFAHPGRQAAAREVVWSWAGVRPLTDDGADDPSKVTRTARIFVKRQGKGGYVTLYGGKLTTHRRLAEKTMRRLQRMGARLGGNWTHGAPLYGGRYDRDALKTLARTGTDAVPPATRQRWAFTYGDRIEALYDMVARDETLARNIVPGVPEAELRHVRDIEDARSMEDFALRRTKLFLALTATQRQRLTTWFSRQG